MTFYSATPYHNFDDLLDLENHLLLLMVHQLTVQFNFKVWSYLTILILKADHTRISNHYLPFNKFHVQQVMYISTNQLSSMDMKIPGFLGVAVGLGGWGFVGLCFFGVLPLSCRVRSALLA